MSAATIKEQKKSKRKKTAHSFLCLEGKVYQYPSVYFHVHDIDLLKQYL